jgi:Tfp pilus assembly protein PilZ
VDQGTAGDRDVQTQAEPRFRKRLPCRLKVAGGSHSAMVLNVSRGGLFVQTGAGPPPGAEVRVELDVASHSDSVPIGGKVVWRRMVAPHLRSLTQGGVGVRIESAPEAYYSFLSGMTGEAPRTSPSAGCEGAEPVPEPPSAAPRIQFRIRIKQDGGPRSRTLMLHCESEAEARERAMAIAGSGWVVLELERSS